MSGAPAMPPEGDPPVSFKGVNVKNFFGGPGCVGRPRSGIGWNCGKAVGAERWRARTEANRACCLILESSYV